MNIFTNGNALVTAITNIFISLSALYSFYKIRSFKNFKLKKLWNIFFISVVVDGIFGFIIHGIRMSQDKVNFLWFILSLLFCITINTLLTIFLEYYRNSKKKNTNWISIIIFSIILYALLVIELINGIDFLLTFIIYVCLCLIIIVTISIYSYIKNNNKCFIYYVLAIVIQVLGGILLLTIKSDIFSFDKNGLYHLFMIGTVILFYIGCRKEINQ